MRKPEDNNRHEDDEALQAPPGLVSALKRLPSQAIFIPPTADETVLRVARRHLIRPAKPTWLRWMPWVACPAAALLLLAVARPLLWKTNVAPGGGSRLAQDDLDRARHVDILDAFALARQLKNGATPDPRLDLNGDGVVDERDVAILAARAVKLPKGGRS